jgi:hypothetical protein
VEGDIFLSRNVFRDETYTNYDSESKRQSKERKHPTALYIRGGGGRGRKIDTHTFFFFLSGVGLSPLGAAEFLAYCTSPR